MATQFFKQYSEKKMVFLLLLGFASGLPLALTGSTLQAWMTEEGFDIKTIGFFTLVGQAYVFKFLWAPLMDRYSLPFLGRRRGWLFLSQLLLSVLIFIMGTIEVQSEFSLLVMLAVLIAFLSASQDIVFDAYKTELLPSSERGIGSAASTLGYRVAMLVSGGVALYLAGSYLGWQNTYTVMAFLMLLAAVATYFSPEPQELASSPKTLKQAMTIPFKDFFNRNNAWLILLLIISYKLGDAFAASLNTSFLLKGPGFTVAEVGVINKTVSLVASILGGLVGGWVLSRTTLFRGLLIFGILQTISNLGYWVLAITPREMIQMEVVEWIKAWWPTLTIGKLMLASVALVENFCGGLGTIAFVALLMSLCNRSFSASQFAFLSAIASIGRVYVGPISGIFVEQHGWASFFLFSIMVSLPGLLILLLCKNTLNYTERTGKFAPRTHYERYYRFALYLFITSILFFSSWLLLKLLILLEWLPQLYFTEILFQLFILFLLGSIVLGIFLDYRSLKRSQVDIDNGVLPN